MTRKGGQNQPLTFNWCFGVQIHGIFFLTENLEKTQWQFWQLEGSLEFFPGFSPIPRYCLLWISFFFLTLKNPPAILAEVYCFTLVLKNLECLEWYLLGFLCLKILHRSQIRWPQKFCFSLSLSLSLYIYISVIIFTFKLHLQAFVVVYVQVF